MPDLVRHGKKQAGPSERMGCAHTGVHHQRQSLARERSHEPSTAVTVRLRNGEVSATDGPFAEIKEHLGGFVLIEAKNIEEAKTIASSFPILKYSSIEVRPTYAIQDGK